MDTRPPSRCGGAPGARPTGDGGGGGRPEAAAAADWTTRAASFWPVVYCSWRRSFPRCSSTRCEGSAPSASPRNSH